MKLFNFIILISLFIFLVPIHAHADDTDLFTVKVPPDALLVLDLSGSMNWTPAGSTMYIADTQTCGDDVEYYPTSGAGHTQPCSIDTSSVPKYSNAACSGPFYKTSLIGYSTDCSRLEIAKRAIFDLLDDNDDNKINRDDQDNLGIRIGYMKFYNCTSDDTGGDYSGGCITLITPITVSNSEDPTPYDKIWSAVSNEKSEGGTPLASALSEAKIYLDDTKIGNKAKDIKADSAAECRKKFVISVTDGSDTFACSGSGSEVQIDQYKRRRESVVKAKALSDSGYKVFVVGFGATMPHHLRNTLNWMAYFGGTDNPLVDNSPSPITNFYHPETVLSCQDDSSTSHNLGDGDHYYATSNDPGEINLGGYAFLAADASQLTAALKAIIQYIQGETYFYTTPSVPTVRIIGEDRVYISSMFPNDTPFWKGNFKAYQLNKDGTLPVDGDGKPLSSNIFWKPNTDEGAGEILKGTDPNSRNILTYVRGSVNKFNQTNLADSDLNLGLYTNNCNSICQKLISYVRGTDTYNIKSGDDKNWKLGDIFHSNAVIVGEPSRFFEDAGFNGPNGFYEENKNRTKVVIVGANDGMLHAFNAATGVEEWAFIPNCLLKNLKSMTKAHTYYVDSSPKVADVWFYSASNPSGKTKTKDEWKTVLVCGLRKGGQNYFALDITDTKNPQYLWEFPKPTDLVTLAKVGQSWSEPAIGRVKIKAGSEIYERWVAFIGGGFDTFNRGFDPFNKGRAFFVIDIKTGDIIKEFSGLVWGWVFGMDYSLAAPPTAVDSNFDGYVDKVYIGDLGGQMWVFDVSSNNITEWTGTILFKAPGGGSEKHPIYYQPAVAFDKRGTPWVFFGTGDRENPNDKNSNERFYAVKDDGKGNYPREEEKKDLKDVTTYSETTFKTPGDPPYKGWYIQLAKSEKVLAKPAVFHNLLYFTTYTYTSTDECKKAGKAKLYTVEYLSGGGALVLDDYLYGKPSARSEDLSEGVPSAPVISVSLKGQAIVIIGTTKGKFLSKEAISSTTNKEILYWREVIP